MLGADIVTVTSQNGKTATVEDRYVPWAAYPLLSSPLPFPQLDEYNNWHLSCLTSTETTLTAVVHRLLNTYDGQDRPIQPGSIATTHYLHSTTSCRVLPTQVQCLSSTHGGAAGPLPTMVLTEEATRSRFWGRSPPPRTRPLTTRNPRQCWPTPLPGPSNQSSLSMCVKSLTWAPQPDT